MSPRFKPDFVAGMFVGGALLGAGLLLGGAGGQDEVAAVLRARQVEIVDEVGTVRMVLGANSDGGSLSVRDRLGRTMLQAGATRDGGSFVIREASENARPVLIAGATANGASLVLLREGQERVVELVAERNGGRLALGRAGATLPEGAALRLGVDRNGAGALGVFGLDGGKLLDLNGEGGSGALETYRAGEGHPLVTLSSTIGGHGQIKTSAGLGRPIVRLTATAENEGQIYTYDGSGKPMVAIASRSGGPSIRVYGRSGTPVITLESDEEGRGSVGVWSADGRGRSITP